MEIKLTNTGKRFNREWIFRRFNHTFLLRKTYAITGPNGSGKSTLLQVISGALMQTEGTVEYLDDSGAPIHQPVQQLSITAPYLELIEEMTATELLNFHSVFKKFIKPIPAILQEVGLEKAAGKQIRNFSSGMKQRLKLAQAFFSAVPVLLLDEPTTNLDEDGIALYHRLIRDYAKEKTIIISSNDKQEYSFCDEIMDVGLYK